MDTVPVAMSVLQQILGQRQGGQSPMPQMQAQVPPQVQPQMQPRQLAVRGPGDGQSDDVPALIDGQQPAKLADGEFIWPADAVSALGNGSTEAGHRKLYQMLDMVRQKAYGRTKQISPVNTPLSTLLKVGSR